MCYVAVNKIFENIRKYTWLPLIHAQKNTKKPFIHKQLYQGKINYTLQAISCILDRQ